ncbi:DMT family transporter [bacterium]|nr:DMT family transporter [bacterium]
MRLLGFLTLCLIWGTTWLAIKFSLDGFPPFLSAGVRFAIAAITVGIMLLFRRQSIRISAPTLKILIIASFLMYALDYGLIYWGELTLNAGVTAIFFATFAIFTALWSTIFLKTEKLTTIKWSGLALGLLGIGIVFYDQLAITQFNTRVMLSILGIILGSASGALSNVLVKRYMQKIDAGVITFYQMSIGICFLFLIGFTFEDPGTIMLTPKVILSILYLALVGSAFAFVMYFKLLKVMNTVTLSLIIYVTPIIALIVDYIVFGEMVPLRSIIGMIFIFCGIALVQRKSNINNKPS